MFLWNPRLFTTMVVGLSAWGVPNPLCAQPTTNGAAATAVAASATSTPTAGPLPPSASLTTSPMVPVIEPERAEAKRLPPPEARMLTIGVGLGATALWYAGALGIGEMWTSAPGRDHLKIPIAGPFLDLSKTGCPASEPNCSLTELVLRTVLVSLDALGQSGSLAIAIQGIVMSTATAGQPAVTPPASVPTQTSFRIVPQLASDTGTGVTVLGTF